MIFFTAGSNVYQEPEELGVKGESEEPGKPEEPGKSVEPGKPGEL